MDRPLVSIDNLLSNIIMFLENKIVINKIANDFSVCDFLFFN